MSTSSTTTRRSDPCWRPGAGCAESTVHGHHPPWAVHSRYDVVPAVHARHGPIVAISHSQASHADGVPIAAVIHHGVDLDAYRPGPGDGRYLLFVGRMAADKGVHRAVHTLAERRRRLVIATKIWEPDERIYSEERCGRGSALMSSRWSRQHETCDVT